MESILVGNDWDQRCFEHAESVMGAVTCACDSSHEDSLNGAVWCGEALEKVRTNNSPVWHSIQVLGVFQYQIV